MPIKLEICAQSITSALIAQEGGADRIELCAALELGGLTPSYALILAAKQRLSIPIHVLIRPRAGDFTYSDDEYALIKQDILFCREQGVEGVVVGVLDETHELDKEKMAELRDLARPMDITCHRAIDRTPDPSVSLAVLMDLGYDRVLTSGGAENVALGSDKLADMVRLASDTIEVMPGGGVTVENILSLLEKTGASDIHLSAKHFLTDKNCWETDLAEVKKVVAILKGQLT
jgi:copper homeostasis protein